MLQCGILGILCFCAALALTPVVRWVAVKVGALDAPGERKIHRVPTPRLGGLALVLAIFSSFLCALAVEPVAGAIITPYLGGWVPILLGAGLVFVAGVWDDLRPLPAWVKLLFQAAAASVATSFTGPIEHVSILGDASIDLGVLAIPLTLLWIIGVTNAFNLIDGLDGLAAGLASIAAGTSAAIFLLRGDVQDAMLLIALLGALLGFLRYNFAPAQIFLGDSGSLVVGYILAVTALSGSQKEATTLAVVTPLLIFGLPILDTLLSIVRRFIGGLRLVRSYKPSFKATIHAAKLLFQADRGHIHHRLIALGLLHRHAVLLLYAMSLGLSLLALLTVVTHYRHAGLLLLWVGLATYIGLRKLGYEEVAFLRTDNLLRWYEQLSFNRLFFLGFLDTAIIAVAFWGSFLLKYERQWTIGLGEWYLNVFPLVLVIQLFVFTLFGLYKGVWRAATIADLIPVVLAVSAGAALSYTITQFSGPPHGTLAFFGIDLLFLGALMAGSRSVYRILDWMRYCERRAHADTLIYGAGRGGQLVLRELLHNPSLGLRPIGFLDDAPHLQGRWVNRVPVLGSVQDFETILRGHPVSTLSVSSENIDTSRLQQALRLCKQRGVSVLQVRLRLEALQENLLPSCESSPRRAFPFIPLIGSMPSSSKDKV